MVAHGNELVLVCNLSRIDRRHALRQQRKPCFGLIKFILWRRKRLQDYRVSAIRIEYSAGAVGMLRDAFRIIESQFKFLNLPVDSWISRRRRWQIVGAHLTDVRSSKFAH